MKVKIIIGTVWSRSGCFSKGEVVELPDEEAAGLIANRWAAVIEEPAVQVETFTVTEEVSAEEEPKAKRRRKREVEEAEAAENAV